MSLKVPKYPKKQSSVISEKDISPISPRNPSVFHTRVKPDYSPLKKVFSKDKVKNCNKKQ